jgi:predicted lipid-binding transport protein (Tim44 family)
MFPEAAERLREEMRRRAAEGVTVEFRNLCVRKVDLVLVRNFADNSKDEFDARISAHAQRVRARHGRAVELDECVAPFEEYWVFGRLDGCWKMKEVLQPDRGAALVARENLDEDSSPEQVQWYYKHTRAT